MDGGESSIFNEKIAENYDRWYESKEGRHFDELEKDLMLKLIKPKYGESLLDIGCGTGHHLKWFKIFGLKLAGVDNSEAMLEVAKRNLNRVIELQLADAKKLPYPENRFDIVTMITTLEFLDDPRPGLREALRVTKNRAFLGVLNKYSLLSLKRRIKGIFLKDPIWSYARFFSIWELLRLIKGLDGNLKANWETVIPNSGGRNPFGAFIGILIKKGT